MTTIQKIEELNKIDQNELSSLTKIIYESIILRRKYKSAAVLDKKEELLDNFSSLIEKYLELNFIKDKEKKLELIDFIDKLNMQRELLELAKGEIDEKTLKIASGRLGRKSQSAFRLKK